MERTHEERCPMILHPSIIALCAASLFISLMVSYSAFYGIKILKGWDIKSGSELQLVLERKTYLISTILGYAFAFYLLSLFLYVFTVDRLHVVFTGAMCAAGVLKVNNFGYPTLILKIIVFLFAGIWLIVNHVDNRAYDYPLIKKKYLLLLVFSPLVIVEMISQDAYFFLLRPNIITSCCGSLFSAGGSSLSSELAALPIVPMMAALITSLLLVFYLGLSFYRKGGKEYLFSILVGITFLISIASIVSFISVYYYELPTHHCPFCILQKEYGYVGYFLYIALLSGAVSGMGTGVLAPFKKIESLAEIVPPIQRKLALYAMVSFAVFAVLVAYRIVVSNLVLIF
jgi:hypothetical protein